MNEREIIIVRFFRKNTLKILAFIWLTWLITDLSDTIVRRFDRIERKIDRIDKFTDLNYECLREKLDSLKKEIQISGEVLWDSQALTRAHIHVSHIDTVRIANSLAGFDNDHIKPIDYVEILKSFRKASDDIHKEKMEKHEK